MANVTSTNRTDISYVEEVTAGTTPPTPTMQILPTTGGAPESETSTEVSQVIRSDRMTDDLILVDLDIMGDIEYELSYAPYKPLIEALLRGTPVTVTITGAIDIQVDATSNPNRLISTTTDFVAQGIVAGMSVRFTGFSNTAENDGIYYVSRVVDANNLEVIKTGIVDEAAGATVDGDSYFVPNGEDIIKSFTFQKRVLGLTLPVYFTYPGIQINEMSFNFETGTILNGSMGVMGLTETVDNTGISGATFQDPPSYAIMNSVSSVTEIVFAGLDASSCFSNITTTINNNIEGSKCIGTLGASSLAAFTLDVMNEASVYFASKDVYDFYINSTVFGARTTLQDSDGNIIVMDQPKCKFETLETPIDGKDEFFMADGSFRALRDENKNLMISFSFFDAPTP